MISPSGMFPLHMWLINWIHFEQKSSTQLVQDIFNLLLKTDSRIATFKSQILTGTTSELIISSQLLHPSAYGISKIKRFEIYYQAHWGDMLPLHIACRNSLPPQQVIQTLLDAYQEGCELTS
jgi:hypothetical protein